MMADWFKRSMRFSVRSLLLGVTVASVIMGLNIAGVSTLAFTLGEPVFYYGLPFTCVSINGEARVDWPYLFADVAISIVMIVVSLSASKPASGGRFKTSQ